ASALAIAARPIWLRARAGAPARGDGGPQARAPYRLSDVRADGAVRRGPRDPRDHDRLSFIDERPDTTIVALQALNDDFLYFNVAGSGPTFPVAQRAAERFRTWLNEVGMFGHVGYAAYNAALEATRADLATTLGDPGGAARVALAQSATDGLNTLVAGLAIPPRSIILT